MPSEKLIAALNKLLNGEIQAHHVYLQAAAWAAERSLTGCSTFLLGHASEELAHMHRFFKFLVDIGAPVKFEAIPAPEISVNDVKGLFTLVRDHELKVTANIDTTYDLARAENDHAVVSFMKWFVDEQHEENTLCRDILDRIKLIGEGPSSNYFVDKELAALAAAAVRAAAAKQDASAA